MSVTQYHSTTVLQYHSTTVPQYTVQYTQYTQYSIAICVMYDDVYVVVCSLKHVCMFNTSWHPDDVMSSWHICHDASWRVMMNASTMHPMHLRACMCTVLCCVLYCVVCTVYCGNCVLCTVAHVYCGTVLCVLYCGTVVLCTVVLCDWLTAMLWNRVLARTMHAPVAVVST